MNSEICPLKRVLQQKNKKKKKNKKQNTQNVTNAGSKQILYVK